MIVGASKGGDVVMQNAPRESMHVERGGREGPNVSHLTLAHDGSKGPSAF